MGQLLLIHDRDRSRREQLLGRALEAFDSLCQIEPVAQRTAGAIAVCKFPRLLGKTTGIDLDDRCGAWTCGAGTWFYRGESAQSSLPKLNGALHTPGTSPATKLEDLDGSFAIASGDKESDSLQVLTDRVGTIHVYLTRIGPALLISTSCLVLATLSSRDWDLASCREFLATGTVFENRTLFRGITKLEPATLFRFKDGELTSRTRYWNPASVMYDRGPRDGSVADLAEALQAGLSMIADTYRRPVMDLTGGFDSRALLGAMLKADITFQTVVNGDDSLPDVAVANRIAQSFGLQHRQQSLPDDWPSRQWARAKVALALGDGEINILEYARVLEYHLRLANEFDISINGSGGEFCKGYWWELLLPFIGGRHFDERKLAAGRFATDRWCDELLDAPFSQDLAGHFADVIRRANRGLETHPNTARMDNVYLVLRMQRWQGRIASATNRIWPCASPFMFTRPMEIAFSAPPRLRVRNRMTRRLIEHLNPRLAAMPLADGYPALPLRLGTAHLFGPLAVHVGRKAWGKVVRTFRRSPDRKRPLRSVIELLKQDEVRDLLDPTKMLTGELYRQGLLRAHLDSSNGHINPSHLGRLLTLEVLARAVRGTRSSWGPGLSRDD